MLASAESQEASTKTAPSTPDAKHWQATEPSGWATQVILYSRPSLHWLAMFSHATLPGAGGPSELVPNPSLHVSGPPAVGAGSPPPAAGGLALGAPPVGAAPPPDPPTADGGVVVAAPALAHPAYACCSARQGIPLVQLDPATQSKTASRRPAQSAALFSSASTASLQSRAHPSKDGVAPPHMQTVSQQPGVPAGQAHPQSQVSFDGQLASTLHAAWQRAAPSVLSRSFGGVLSTTVPPQAVTIHATVAHGQSQPKRLVIERCSSSVPPREPWRPA